MDTTAPSGDWLDRILGGASDFGDKWLDYKSWEMFRDESGAADNAEITDNWQRIPGYGGATAQKDNTVLYVGIGVAVVAALYLMKK